MRPRVLFLLALAFVAVRGILHSFYGLELMDTGWHLNFYQQFFDEPASVSYNFLYYLNGLIGGACHALFPGIFSGRILGVITLVATFALGYRLLADVFEPRAVLLGLLLVVLCGSTLIEHFYYNPLSILLFLAAVLFLKNAIFEDRPFCAAGAAFGAAFALTLNIFSRLPNVLALALFVFIPLFAFLRRRGFAWLCRQTAAFAAGAGAALALVFAIMSALGHVAVFREALATMNAISASPLSTHSLVNVIRENLLSYIQVFNAGILPMFAAGTAVLVLNAARKYALGVRLGVFALTGAAAVVLFTYNLWATRMLWFYFIALAAGGVFMVSIAPRWRVLDDVEQKRLLLVLAGFALLLYFPIGSDVGVFSAGASALWLAFPVACGLLPAFYKDGVRITLAAGSGAGSAAGDGAGSVHTINITAASITGALLVFAGGFWLVEIKNSAAGTYNDPGYFFYKRAGIDSPLADRIHANPRLVKNLNTLLGELRKRTRPGDIVFCYDSVPLVNYLSETRAYAGNAWPCVYPADVLERKLRDAEQRGEFPRVCVVQKISRVLNRSSPFEPVHDYFEPTVHSDYHSFHRAKVVKEFFRRHDYRRVDWSNEYFEIWAR